MNVERLNELADTIEKQPHGRLGGDSGFCLSRWTYGEHCGNPAGISGWAVYLFHSDPASVRWFEAETTAARLLELDFEGPSGARALFFPQGRAIDTRKVTPESAARVIRNFVQRGWSDWTPELNRQRS